MYIKHVYVCVSTVYIVSLLRVVGCCLMIPSHTIMYMFINRECIPYIYYKTVYNAIYILYYLYQYTRINMHILEYIYIIYI